MNAFLFYSEELSHNYVIKIFTACATAWNYLDNGKFHVGKNRGTAAKNVEN